MGCVRKRSHRQGAILTAVLCEPKRRPPHIRRVRCERVRFYTAPHAHRPRTRTLSPVTWLGSAHTPRTLTYSSHFLFSKWLLVRLLRLSRSEMNLLKRHTEHLYLYAKDYESSAAMLDELFPKTHCPQQAVRWVLAQINKIILFNTSPLCGVCVCVWCACKPACCVHTLSPFLLYQINANTLGEIFASFFLDLPLFI